MEKGLLEKIGKFLVEWKKIVKVIFLEKYGEIMKYFKSEYGLMYGFVNFVILKYWEVDVGFYDVMDLVNV